MCLTHQSARSGSRGLDTNCPSVKLAGKAEAQRPRPRPRGSGHSQGQRPLWPGSARPRDTAEQHDPWKMGAESHPCGSAAGRGGDQLLAPEELRTVHVTLWGFMCYVTFWASLKNQVSERSLPRLEL